DYLRKIKKWNDVATEDHIIDEHLSKLEDYHSTVETIVEKKFLKNILLQEIDELKPEHKQVLILAYLHDMRYEEIAEALDIKVTKVKTPTQPAKLKIRDALETKPDVREMGHKARA